MANGTLIEEWRVLVVEDDRSVASVHCRFVAQQPGFRVVGRAETAEQARQLLATAQPHLVLLDLGLPGPSGLTLLRDLRNRRIPVEVIVITAHATPDIVRSSMQLGAIDYLVKPFWPDRLTAALQLFLTRMEGLQGGSSLDQTTIDRLRASGSEQEPTRTAANIRLERLEDVRAVLDPVRAMTAEDVAGLTGMARVTARRYLEHLVSRGQCTVDAVADGPGRPRKAYRLWLTGRMGADSDRA